MKLRVLGSTSVIFADEPVALPARKPRSILAALAMTPGATVSADRLVDLVWGDEPPVGAHGTLHAYLSGLRRVLEPDLAPRARPTVLVTTDHGYRLNVDPVDIDAAVFARGVRSRHSALAPLWSQLTTGPGADWPDREAVTEHVETLEGLLRLWGGTAYADLGDHPDVLADRASLEELRATAEEDTALGLLALGEHAAVLAATQLAGARHPLRERTRSLQALALVRSGRQVEALEVLRAYRELLAEELGLDPSPEVRMLEQAVLRQDPALSGWLRPPVAATGVGETRPSAAAAAGDPSPGVPPRPAGRLSTSWPIVGRDAERSALAGLIAAAAEGSPGVALVVGEPGTGKTRVADEALQRAAEDGFAAAVGRCSADDGAPPLWPWYALLEGLGLEQPDALGRGASELDAEGAFVVQDALARAVRQQAQQRPVLLVVEDLHWADTRTLRALAHLVDTWRPGDRVALLTTRRPRPQPAGALADFLVTAVRHGASRFEFGALDQPDAARLVSAVTGASSDQAREWRARSGGNPFFLVELARLAASNGGLAAEVPESVQSVVARRMQELPEATRDVLLVSAALGREHSALALAQAGGWSAADVADRLEPAQDAGLLHVRPDGRLAFEHALTRDAVLAASSPATVARTHARIAHALDGGTTGTQATAERAYDLARHWLAAGPVYAPQAWRAAAAAAGEAHRAFANPEAAELYAAALNAHALDPDGSREDRYGLLLSFAEAAAWAAKWRPVVQAVVEAVALARADADPDRMARAVAELTRYSVWLPQEYLEVDDDLVEDLRSALDGLTHHDSPVRCTLMLALAMQLYYRAGSRPEIEALVDEGLAVARRLGDPVLRGWAARTAWLALWRSADAHRRRELGLEEVAAAQESGDQAAEAVAHVGAAGTAVELGDLQAWQEHSAAASAIARRRRLSYVEFVLHLVRLNLSCLADAQQAADAEAELARAMSREAATPAQEWTEFGINYIQALWRPDLLAPMAEAMLAFFLATPEEMGRTPVLHVLALAGRVDDLRAELDRAPLTPLIDSWDYTGDGAVWALVAATLGDPHVARRSLDVLRPVSGRMAVSGIALVLGPVDGFLAAALAVLGERAEASQLADRAVALATRWTMPAYLRWLGDLRDRLGF